MIDNAFIPQPRTDIVLQDVDGESLILDNNENLIHQLNDTATFIWQYCNGKNTVSDIVSLLVGHYNISEEDAVCDVTETIENFKGLNLFNE